MVLTSDVDIALLSGLVDSNLFIGDFWHFVWKTSVEFF